MSSTPLPKDDPQEKRRRVQALVKQLKGRLVVASDLPQEANREQELGTKRTWLGAPRQGATLESATSVKCEPGSITDFYPEAKPLEGGEGRAWVLRSEVPFDGAPLRSGVYLPQEDLLPHLDVSLARVFNLGTDFEGFEKESLAFIDLECTGLMGGTGTYPFLVGVGFFEGERFVVEQYFMEDFPDEPAMLGPLRDRLKSFEGLVSFNGKTFDAPLLRTRFLMNRMPSPVELPHLDLLHAARRLWKGRLESCSFGSIEREIFAMRRISDVPGALIPAIYLDYVKGIQRAQMVPVIDHNAQDIVSMASLLALFCKVFHEPTGPLCQHKTDQIGLSCWYRRAGQAEESIRCVERAVLLCREPDEEHALSMHLANLYRRSSRWEDAIDVWRERARVATGFARLGPCICLSKYYEHHLRDCREALFWAERAITYIETEAALKPRLNLELPDLQKRLERLKKKQSAKKEIPDPQ